MALSCHHAVPDLTERFRWTMRSVRRALCISCIWMSWFQIINFVVLFCACTLCSFAFIFRCKTWFRPQKILMQWSRFLMRETQWAVILFDWVVFPVCVCVRVCVCVHMLVSLQAAFSDFLQRSSRDLSKHVRVVVSVNTLALYRFPCRHVGQQVGLLIKETVYQLLSEQLPCWSVIQWDIESWSKLRSCWPLTSVLGLEQQLTVIFIIDPADCFLDWMVAPFLWS